MTMNSSVAWSKLSLTGVIDLQSVQSAHARLVAAFGQGGPLEIDVGGVTGLDLTLVQLVESARRTAAEAGMAIRLAAPAAGVLLETLERGGFLADPQDPRTRFWRGAGA